MLLHLQTLNQRPDANCFTITQTDFESPNHRLGGGGSHRHHRLEVDKYRGETFCSKVNTDAESPAFPLSSVASSANCYAQK